MNIILQVLRQSLDRAVKRGWLETNPAREVERLREDKVEILPFSFEEVRLFLDKGLMDEALRRYFTVAFFSGLRPSEQMGLAPVGRHRLAPEADRRAPGNHPVG